VHGLVLGGLGALLAGSPLRLVPRFRPEAIVEAVAPDATQLLPVPTMIHRLAEHLEADPAAARTVGRARLLISGSAALPLREHARIERTTGRRVVERYGLTETLINTAVRADGAHPPGTVGPPLPGVEMRLEGEGDGPREVLVRGPSLFAGYLNRPDATSAALDPSGFFRTGDLGTLEPGGALRLLGRKATDLLKTGGFKVGAGEVEAALLEHAAVAEAAVVGAPDPDLGERIVAYVVLRPGASATAQALIEHVAGSLSPHKRPREVHVIAALPRNAMGKVLKRQLGIR
jgi:malonyl-CoA/methylmalonyl-CoA synthetase